MVEYLPEYRSLSNDKRYTLVFGGRGSAKSFHVACWAIEHLYNVNERGLFLRYTMASAKLSIIPEFEKNTEALGVSKAYTTVDKTIKNVYSNSSLTFAGIKTSSGNQTANLKSLAGISFCIFDEAEEIPDLETFDKIDNSIRIKGTQNRIFLVFNTPHIHHWIYKEFFRKKREDVEYIWTNYTCNIANLNQSFIDKANRIKLENPRKYSRIYLGEWGRSEDLVFPKGYKLYTTEEEPTSHDSQVIFGGDFGYTHDPNVFVRTQLVGNKLYLREIFRERGLADPESLAQRIHETGYANEISVWDKSGKASIAGIKRKNVRAYPSATAKMQSSVYQGLSYLQGFDILIHEDSVYLQKEWETYQWAKNGDEFVRNSKDELIPSQAEYDEGMVKDHGIDAVRYARVKFAKWD